MSAVRVSVAFMTEIQTTLRPESVADVAAGVRRAVHEGAAITVVGGGHGPWSHAPYPGIRIELAELATVEVDGTTVRVGGGATWGSVAETLEQHGLALSSGDTASVGVGGLTVGGGIGWMTRAWGAAVDQLVGVQVVTADGEIIEASAEQNPDLFWAVRGGGGNFGIVTRFDFAAHPLDGIAHAECTIDGDAAAVLRAMRDMMPDAPRELTVTYLDVPPMDPSAPAGARVVAVWAAPDPDALTRAIARITAVPGVRTVVTTPRYRDILMEMPEPPEEAGGPPSFLGGNGLHAELDDALIDRLVAFRAEHPASVVFLRSLGGAFGDVAHEDTPFPAREAEWFVLAGGFDVPGMLTPRERDAVLADARSIQSGRLAEYGNFVDGERPDGAVGMHTPEALERLREAKRRWDPRNVFRRNHNIVV